MFNRGGDVHESLYNPKSCVCVCARARECVDERERERARARERERERERGGREGEMFVAWRVREGGRKRVCRQRYKIEYPVGEEGKRSSSLVLRHLQLQLYVLRNLQLELCYDLSLYTQNESQRDEPLYLLY